MVQSYSPVGANVPSHVDTMASPSEYDWSCASFGPPESTIQTANRSVQSFLLSSPQKVSVFTMGSSFPKKLPFPTGNLDTHLIHGSLNPPESSTQMVSRSGPFLHRQLQSVPILYNGTPLPPSHRGSGPKYGTLGSPESSPKQHFDRFSHFCRAH